MPYKLNLGSWNNIFAVPTCVVDNYIKLCSGDNLKVLLYLLRNSGCMLTSEDIASVTGLEAVDVSDAVLFWEQRGLISPCSDELVPGNDIQNKVTIKVNPLTSEAVVAKNMKKVDLSRDPQFLPKEIAGAVRNNKGADFLFSKCEQLYGRGLTHNEQNCLMLITEDAGLPVEVAVMLVEYCFSINKSTPAYMRAVALDWVERDITTISAAESQIKELKVCYTAENEIKHMFEVQNALSNVQKKLVKKWISEFNFSMQMIEAAYQRTLNGTGKLVWNYIDKILTGWHIKNIDTLEKIQQDVLPVKEKQTSSFDVNELDEMDLERYKKG